MKTTTFPECVYLGEFDSDEYGNLPAYLPAVQGGFCLHYSSDQEHFVNRQIENTVLCTLEDTPANLLKVEIFDFANRPNFPFLNQLKNDGLSHTSLNEQATTNAFNELESIIQHRYHTLFSSNEIHINQYNARSPRPECYYVLIINTAYFPNSSMSAQRMHNFLTSAYGAGIYVIVLHDEDFHKQNDYSNNSQALQKLLKMLPIVRMTEQSLWVDEKTLPVQKMANFDFSFTPANINQNQIIKDIQQQLHTDTYNTDDDFLSVKIGTRPDGGEAYLNMGKASMNYHAMILGRTGTGKSTLMNNIIMQIGEQYNADQIRLYLMDYKQGVEFNKFKDHPNVEKIFLKSNDISAGVALLEQLKQDIEDRYELFKGQDIESIHDYNRSNSNQLLPYILLMVDEFHKLLKGDFRHQEYVNTLLEEIAKIGRGAGVHLLLSTQSLKGVNLDGSVKDQIDLRMTYNVVNDMALGFDIFDSRHTSSILGLQKYEVFIQAHGQAFTAFVDKPYEIQQTIQRLRDSRPAHLQVKAEVMKSDTKNLKNNDGNPTTQTSQDSQTDNVEVINPNEKKFQDLNKLIAEAESKLKQKNENSDNGVDVPDWMK